MRLLLAQAGVADPRGGTSQLCSNLARALQALGHEVTVFATGAPPGIRWWKAWAWHRARLEAFLQERPGFEIVDAPPVLISQRVARRVPAIARSVQPDLRYLDIEKLQHRSRLWRSPLRSLASLAYARQLASEVLAGWQRARLVLCLGASETLWLRQHQPHLGLRLRTYVVAPSASEQQALAALRARRAAGDEKALRFLWIGRWSAHKGPDVLLDWIERRSRAAPGDGFTIAGCGQAGVEGIRARLGGAQGRIRVVPAFERGELPSLLEGHDVGLFTSRAEGWGHSLQEMLESGMTVLATREGAFAELAPCFPHSLRPLPPPAAPLKPALASEASPREGYYERFSWPTIARAYEEVAREAMAAEGGP